MKSGCRDLFVCPIVFIIINCYNYCHHKHLHCDSYESLYYVPSGFLFDSPGLFGLLCAAGCVFLLHRLHMHQRPEPDDWHLLCDCHGAARQTRARLVLDGLQLYRCACASHFLSNPGTHHHTYIFPILQTLGKTSHGLPQSDPTSNNRCLQNLIFSNMHP